ncbi:MAG: tRNA (uridine(34)/cytosine(34)/5-carboxymethylaminomethyluridine(34)-2'-O)-methyltransferase TrmL [Arenicellales bacterium]|nr:tRNA (uridine(34)/cytosine(34)/5-carboxymethylaminomethyluridine(34)-2'-O)-methyltransferase TrmL [Gammaproteobacteria bacterium]NDG43710.1 tRNA (uridine(34)/cytosine(34)/5-carboxymethylaminomethyluridine(34)-2'-O)-methyltransferase TrmL [Gammaproteobacteria bacterium]
MFQIVLYQPEIPPNTGNIIRLCANTGCSLHLIEPLGFSLDARELKRAGLDYAKEVSVIRHQHFRDFFQQVDSQRVFMFSTKHQSAYSHGRYQSGDALVFGPETRGLPEDILNMVGPEQRVTIPMRPSSRSLNLSNAVAIGVYEAWRQCAFEGAAESFD